MLTFSKTDSIRRFPSQPISSDSRSIEEDKRTALEENSECIQQFIQQRNLDVRNAGRREFESPMTQRKEQLLAAANLLYEAKPFEIPPEERLLQRILQEEIVIEKNPLEQGMVLAASKICAVHQKFKATVYLFTKDEGGSHQPFFTGCKSQFYFGAKNIIGTATLPAEIEKVMPGDYTELQVELFDPVSMEEGVRFAIQEKDRTIGAGTVSKILK